VNVRLPPRYVNLPSFLVYSDLPPSIQRTGERIYGLAWEHNRKRTPEEKAELPTQFTTTLKDLIEVCQVSRRQLFAHLRVLVKRGILRYSYSRSAGIYVFTLPPRSQWPPPRSGPELSAENRTQVTVPDDDPTSIDLSVDHHQYSTRIEGGSGGESAQCGKPHAARLGIVDRVGIDEPTRSEIAELPWCTVEYLAGWADWFESQTDKGVGWLVVQIRKARNAPEPIVEVRLPGRGHDRTRYVTGEYADLIQR
jgi:hypothetical protein